MNSHLDKPQSKYTLKLEVYDERNCISWISSFLPEGLNGTTARHIAIYKDKEGKLQQINFWGEMNIMSLEATEVHHEQE